MPWGVQCRCCFLLFTSFFIYLQARIIEQDQLHMKYILTLILSLVALMGMAQSEEKISPDEKLKWSAGGLFMLMAPYADDSYYEKDKERYVPQTSMVWLGSTRLSDRILQGSQSPFHLRNGFLKQQEGGVTFLQFSRNLYRGLAGYTVGLQFVGTTYAFKDYNNELNLYAARIPLLVGIQTPRRWLSLQTGLGLYAGGSKYKYRYKGEDKSDKHHLHTSHVGVQWLLTAGIGPVTVNYTQNLTPLFKLADGTNAYPSSFTVGIDIWYLMCRLSRNKD